MKRTMFLWIAAALIAGVPFTAIAGPCVDSDGDGLCNALDNCTLRANLTQTDTDADLCGNRCDADFNQDGVVAVADFSSLVAAFAGPGIPPGLQDIGQDPPDGVVAAADFSQLVADFTGAPGPSGTTPGTIACP
jgi:hypothetical protein